MSNETPSDDKAREAFTRVAEVVKVLKGLDRGAERRGLEGACRMYSEMKSDLDEALPLIQKIPEYGETLAQTIYLLRGIANMSCPKED